MSYFASTEHALHTIDAIGHVVDERTAAPFEDDSGKYDVVHVPIKTPAIIGGKLAVTLRLAKGCTGKLGAAASYHSDEQCQSLPLRHITLSKSGEAEGVFDGTMDANSYRLPADYLVQLEADLVPAFSQT